MNYCIAAFGVVLIIASVQWIVDSRKTFKGPKTVTLEGQNGERDVLNGELGTDNVPMEKINGDEKNGHKFA